VAIILPVVAVVDEQKCIGCALCVEVCPVDAIVGAPRLMHTVISAECTGCALCLPPCPVDCIEIKALGELWTHEQRKARAAQYRRRHAARRARLQRDSAEREPRASLNTAEDRKRAAIGRAMQRARERLNHR
jgi:electron transport complex protein RnfB